MGNVKPYRQRKRTAPSVGKKLPKWVVPALLGVSFVTAAVTHSQRGEPDIPVYYPNCDAARQAGVAPIHLGEPGYREPLDADRDGIACEPLPAF